MYLERILGTKTKVNVLAVLIESPGRTFVEKELAGQCGASLGALGHVVSFVSLLCCYRHHLSISDRQGGFFSIRQREPQIMCRM
jgi:hypothetical protein